jgi:hypothetical protein
MGISAIIEGVRKGCAHTADGVPRQLQSGTADGKGAQLQRALKALHLDDALVANVARHSHSLRLAAGHGTVFNVAPVQLSTAVGLGPGGSLPSGVNL